jgi:hypothetical protein
MKWETPRWLMSESKPGDVSSFDRLSGLCECASTISLVTHAVAQGNRVRGLLLFVLFCESDCIGLHRIASVRLPACSSRQRIWSRSTFSINLCQIIHSAADVPVVYTVTLVVVFFVLVCFDGRPPSRLVSAGLATS